MAIRKFTHGGTVTGNEGIGLDINLLENWDIFEGQKREEYEKLKEPGETYEQYEIRREKEAQATKEKQDEAQRQWGAADISKKDFYSPDGKPLTVQEIVQNLNPKLPGLTVPELTAQVRENMPKFQAAPEEEKQFAKEAMKKDVYGISKEARKVGAEARGVYGKGTGASMRGAMTGTEDIAKGFEHAQQAYQQDLYGLERGAEKAYESDIAGWLDADWFKTPTGAREGGLVHKDRSGIGNNRRFNKETFLDVLTQLPEAGGS